MLTVACHNINSFNVSTIGNRNSKSFLKVEGLTQLKADIILVSDCRLKDREGDVSRMLGLNRNCSYKFRQIQTGNRGGWGLP